MTNNNNKRKDIYIYKLKFFFYPIYHRLVFFLDFRLSMTIVRLFSPDLWVRAPDAPDKQQKQRCRFIARAYCWSVCNAQRIGDLCIVLLYI